MVGIFNSGALKSNGSNLVRFGLNRSREDSAASAFIVRSTSAFAFENAARNLLHDEKNSEVNFQSGVSAK
jgi:hypothetical protein